MTISAFDVYLVSTLDRLLMGLFVFSVIAFVAVLWDIIVFVAESTSCLRDEEKQKRALHCAKKYGAWFVVLVLLQVIIPSSKTVAAMYVLPAIINNQHIQNSAGNTLEALEKLTKEWLRGTVKQDSPKQEANI